MIRLSLETYMQNKNKNSSPQTCPPDWVSGLGSYSDQCFRSFGSSSPGNIDVCEDDGAIRVRITDEEGANSINDMVEQGTDCC